jgi:hypothetical protein
MTDPVAAEFIRATRHTLAGGTHKIEHCLSQLSDEQTWWRPREEMNSIANLMLHLSGNVRQWIVSGLGGEPDRRNRPGEFSDRSRRAKSDVLAELKQTIAEADAVLARLTAAELMRVRRIQGIDETVIGANLHTLPHFRGHVQEIIHMTREQLGPAYKIDFVPKGAEQISAAMA